MASRIHLIEKLNLIHPVAEGSKEYESGFWAIPPHTAQLLVGGDIYFHKKQRERSFFGGKILAFRLAPDGEYTGRIIFSFAPDQEHRNVSAGHGGWSAEKKIVLLSRGTL